MKIFIITTKIRKAIEAQTKSLSLSITPIFNSREFLRHRLSVWRQLLFFHAFILILLFPPSLSQAQEYDEDEFLPKQDSLLFIDKLTFSGNTAILTLELAEETFTKANASFLGIKPWLGVYRFGDALFPDSSSNAPNWIVSIKRWIQYSVGEPPAEFDPKTFQLDLAKVREIYMNNGYYDVEVIGTITPSLPSIPEVIPSDTTFYNVDIKIIEGEPTRIEEVVFTGVESLNEDLIKDVKSNTLLKKGEVYSVKRMVAERERLTNVMLNRGYSLFPSDSIKVIADTINHQVYLNFIISPTEFLRFGTVSAVVHDPLTPDSLADFKETFEQDVRIRTYGEQRVKHDVVRRSIVYRPGRETSIGLKNESIRRLGSLGIFEGMTIRNDSITDGYLNTTIELTQLSKHQIKPELKMDNRNNAPFISLAAGYLNRNLLGGAESFNLTTSLGLQLTYNREQFQGLKDSRLIDELPFNFDIGSELTLPYFTSEKSRLIASLRYGVTQPPLLIRVQNVSFRLRAQYVPNDFQRIFFDMIDLEIINYDSARGARQLFITQGRPLDLLDSLVEVGRSLNQTFRFDFTFNNFTDYRRILDVKWTLLLEDSGLLTGLIDKYFDTKPRADFLESDAQIFGLRYFEYRKIFTQLSIAKFFNRFAQGAAKLQIGYMGPYGKSGDTPFIRRFFAGGPNGIRAFPFNSLGPGNNTSILNAQFGADIKIETSIEYRYFFFQTLGKPSGVALFIDAGNIWRRNGENSLSWETFGSSIALGVGYGARIGTPIGPIRLDFAYRVFDPTQPEGNRWVIKKWGLTSFLFNFGIGEAF